MFMQPLNERIHPLLTTSACAMTKACLLQWISGQQPQALGPLRHRVNLSFTASETASERFRALQILRPTVELSGRYLCKVTSQSRDFSRHKRLVVYSE